jgi:F-type H+-transporting ATPase subunit delta
MSQAAPDKPSSPAVDSRTQQVAAVYAKALLGASETAGNSATVVAEFDTLAGLLAQQPKFEHLLASQLLGDDEKQGVIDRVFAAKLSRTAVDFLRVLARRGRLGILRVIAAEIHRQYEELRGLVRVQVSTAAPLDAATIDKLKKSLRAIVPGEPQLEATINPDLIGGAVLRVGDKVYDGSIARQLEQIRSQIINRSVHDIQSRRDRLRHPGGN